MTMNDVLGVILAAALVVLFVACVVFFLIFARNFLLMLPEIRGRRESILANIFPLFSIFLPGLYTEQGNRYRSRMLKFLLLTLCCFGLLFTLKFFLQSGGTGS